MERISLSAGNCIPGLTLPLFAAMLQHIPTHRIAEGLLFHRLKIRPIGFMALKHVGLGGLRHIPRIRKMVVLSHLHMRTHLRDLDQQLRESGGPWILGQQFSLADVSWSVIFERLREADWETLIATPALREYWANLQRRRAFISAMNKHRHPIVTAGTQLIQRVKANAASDWRGRSLLSLYQQIP